MIRGCLSSGRGPHAVTCSGDNSSPLAFIISAIPAYAQQTGVITGKVVDSGGGVLPGVTVEARANVLPVPRVTTTGANGEYRLPALPPGAYTITFVLSGMQNVTRQAEVQLSQDTLVDATLGLGGVTETVEVTATASLIEKDTATIKSGLSNAQIMSLPVGQEYRDLLKLIPGVQYSQDSVRGPSAGGSGQDNVYQFDGVNVTLPLFGTLSAEPSSHDIAQVTTIRAGAQAVDFDRSGGFSIDTISKSGTNRYAGEISYQFQNDNMTAALDSGSASRYEQDRSWLVASIGGPVLPNRLFFYGSCSPPRELAGEPRQPLRRASTVPADAQRGLRQGDVHAGELGVVELQLPRLGAQGHERALRVECLVHDRHGQRSLAESASPKARGSSTHAVC